MTSRYSLETSDEERKRILARREERAAAFLAAQPAAKVVTPVIVPEKKVVPPVIVPEKKVVPPVIVPEKKVVPPVPTDDVPPVPPREPYVPPPDVPAGDVANQAAELLQQLGNLAGGVNGNGNGPPSGTYGPFNRPIPAGAEWIQQNPALDTPLQQSIRKGVNRGLTIQEATLLAQNLAGAEAGLDWEGRGEGQLTAEALQNFLAQYRQDGDEKIPAKETPLELAERIKGKSPAQIQQEQAEEAGDYFELSGTTAEIEQKLRKILSVQRGWKELDPKDWTPAPEQNLLSTEPTKAFFEWKAIQDNLLDAMTQSEAYVASQGGTPVIDKFLKGIAAFDEQVAFSSPFSYEDEVKAIEQREASIRALLDKDPGISETADTQKAFLEEILQARLEGFIDPKYLVLDPETGFGPPGAGLLIQLVQQHWEWKEQSALVELERADTFQLQTIQADAGQTLVRLEAYLAELRAQSDQIRREAMATTEHGRSKELRDLEAELTLEIEGEQRKHDVAEAVLNRAQEKELAEEGWEQRGELADAEAEARENLASLEDELAETRAQKDQTRRDLAATTDYTRRRQLMELEAQLTSRLENTQRSHDAAEAVLDRAQTQKQRELELLMGERGLGQERQLAGLQAFMSLLQNPQALAALQTLQGGIPPGAGEVGFDPSGLRLGGVAGAPGRVFPEGVPTLGMLSGLTQTQGQQLEGAVGTTGLTLQDLIRASASVTPGLFGNLAQSIGAGARRTERG